MDLTSKPLNNSLPAPDLAAYLQASAARHQHLCPRQVLGVRMGLLLGRWLGIPLPQADAKRLHLLVEMDGCFLSGLMVTTGCGSHRRTLHLLDYGKPAVTAVDRATGRAVRLHPHPAAREQAVAAVPEAASRWHAMLIAYQTLPDEALLNLTPVTLTLDLAALISRPSARARCAHCGEDIFNGREVLHAGQIWCRSCAGERYYAEAPP